MEPTVPDTNAAPAARSPIEAGVRCPDCGYDLRGSTSARCSECGYALDLLRSSVSQIPWVYRARLGFVRAYWRTARMVTFRNRRFCAESARSVSYADAQSFRWATVCLAWGTLLVLKLAPWLGGGETLMYLETGEWLLVPIEVGTFLALAAVTGLPGVFLCRRGVPRAAQNRAVALSYYACAPLGYLPLVLIPSTLRYGLRFANIGFFATEEQICIVFVLLAPLLWWWNLVRITHRTLHRTSTTLLVALALPALKLVVAAVTVTAVVVLTLYVVMILYTWR